MAKLNDRNRDLVDDKTVCYEIAQKKTEAMYSGSAVKAK